MIRQCLKCKRNFYVEPSGVLTGRGKYCSRECQWLCHRNTYNCSYCKKEFISPAYRVEKFCSLDCFHKSRRKSEEHRKQIRLEYTRKYRREHPSWAQAMKHKRRALETRFGGIFTPEQWDVLRSTFDYCCVICNRPESERKLTVDHKIPASKWDKWAKEFKPNYKWNDIQNIQPLCGKCNSGKAGNL